MAEEINKDNPDKSTGSWCLECGHAMRHNVPRLGPDGGYVHADTGSLGCGPRKELQISISSGTDEYEKLERENEILQRRLEKAIWTLKFAEKNLTLPETRNIMKDTIEFLESKL